MRSPELVTALVVAAACGGLAWLVVRARAFGRSLTARARAARSGAGEARAVSLLEGRGFRVLARQVTASTIVDVNGVAETMTIRADFLVERKGSRYVADAKTGDDAPNIRNRATRRQLLEYVVAYGVDGALLVDAEAETIHHIGFRALDRRPAGVSLVVVLLALVVGLLVGGYSSTCIPTSRTRFAGMR